MRFVYDDGGRSKYFKAENVRDCAIRAIAIGTGIDYKKVYNDLKELNGGKSCRNGTPKKVDKAYLKSLGWIWHPTMKVGEGCKVHLCENELPNGTIIVAIAKHLTCVIDGVIHDTWNCSIKEDIFGNDIEDECCVYGYYTKPTTESLKAIEQAKIQKERALEAKEKALKAKQDLKAKEKKIKDKYKAKIKPLEKKIKDLQKQMEKELEELRGAR